MYANYGKNKIDQLEKDVLEIKMRNKRVEADKAWEISNFRKIVITITTYLLISMYLHITNVPDPWLNALVPALGYFISTFTLRYLKKFWINRHHHK